MDNRLQKALDYLLSNIDGLGSKAATVYKHKSMNCELQLEQVTPNGMYRAYIYLQYGVPAAVTNTLVKPNIAEAVHRALENVHSLNSSTLIIFEEQRAAFATLRHSVGDVIGSCDLEAYEEPASEEHCDRLYELIADAWLPDDATEASKRYLQHLRSKYDSLQAEAELELTNQKLLHSVAEFEELFSDYTLERRGLYVFRTVEGSEEEFMHYPNNEEDHLLITLATWEYDGGHPLSNRSGTYPQFAEWRSKRFRKENIAEMHSLDDSPYAWAYAPPIVSEHCAGRDRNWEG